MEIIKFFEILSASALRFIKHSTIFQCTVRQKPKPITLTRNKQILLSNMFYNLIEEFLPYFYNLRIREKTVAVDITIPTKWTFKEILTSNGVNYVEADKNEKVILLTLMSDVDKESLDKVMKTFKTIITTNIVREEKEKLFLRKVADLKELFEHSDIETLKNLNLNLDGETEIEQLVTEGDREGQQTDRESQTTDDSTIDVNTEGGGV